MREYLIKAVDGESWIPIHESRLDDVLLPVGWDVRRLEGSGEFRMQAEGAVISITAEDPGWLVAFEEGHMDPVRADALIDQVRAQIEAASGIPAYILVITE